MTIRANMNLYGLVLAGGGSSRMGFDKGLIEYHQMPHRQYLYDLLNKFCTNTFMGLREDQQEEAVAWPLILDDENYQGPFKSILAAHEAHPYKAWLVLACDLPFITENTLRRLVEQRDRNKLATTYFDAQKGYPEPLITIWEPEGLRLAKKHAGRVDYSPVRFLSQADCKLISPENAMELLNANNQTEWEQAKKALE